MRPQTLCVPQIPDRVRVVQAYERKRPIRWRHIQRDCTLFARCVRMRTVTLPLAQFGFVVATRAALAAGVALLVSGRLPEARRRAVGRLLVGIGVITTVPAAIWGFRSIRGSTSSVGSDPRLIGAARYPRKGDDDILP